MDEERPYSCSCGRSFTKERGLEFHRKLHGCEAAEDTPEASPGQPAQGESETITRTASRPEEQAETVVTVPAEAGPESPTEPVLVPPVLRPEPALCLPAVAEEPGLGPDFRRLARLMVAVLGLTRYWVSALTILVSSSSVFLFLLCLATIGSVWHFQDREAPPADLATRSEMEARTVVEAFLESGHLHQYSRARQLMTEPARGYVSDLELHQLFASLPLQQQPEHWRLSTQSAGRRALVTVHRAGADETYELWRGPGGWGLASVTLSMR